MWLLVSGIVKGSESTGQGFYFIENDGTVNLVISASNATNPRIDLVVARVRDSAESGTVNLFELSVVTGVAAGTPVAPTAPDNCLVLASVEVAADVTVITNANITDRRTNTTLGPEEQRGRIAALGGTIVCLSTTRPNSPDIGMEIYETDTGLKYIYDGAAWRLIGGLPASIVKSAVSSSATVTTSEVTLATISLEPGTWIISGSATPNASIAQDTEVVLSLFDAALTRRTFTAHNYDYDSSSALGRSSLAFTFVYVNPSTQNWILTIRRTHAGGSMSVADAHFVCQRIA